MVAMAIRSYFRLSASFFCAFALSFGVSPAAYAQNEEPSEAIDSITSIKAWNFMYETRFEEQDISFRRYGLGETMLLGDFIKVLELPMPARVVACSKDKDGNTSVIKLSGKDRIENFDIFYSVNKLDQAGKVVPKSGENVILSLGFGPSDPYTSGILFIRNTAGEYPKDFLRLSLMLSPRVEQDDFRSFMQSNAGPLTGSYLLSFDTGDSSAYMEEFREVYRSAMAKSEEGKDYNFLEYACILGIMDFPQLSSATSEAEECISEGRYFDAIPILKRVVDADKYFWSGDESENGAYADACADLAKCYFATGDFEQACRFYEVAYSLDDSYVAEFSLALAALGDIRAKTMDAEDVKAAYSKAIAGAKETLGDFSPKLTMRDVVCRGIGIPECSIQSMTAFDMDGKVICKEESRAGALGTKLGTLLSDGNTLVFDYDFDCKLTQADSSVHLTNNSIAIMVKRIEGTSDKFRLNVMVPNFNGDDTVRSLFISGDNPNRPPSISIVVSSAEKGDVPSDPGELFDYAVAIQDDGRYLESLKLLDHVYKTGRATGYDPDKFDVGWLIDVCYEIGFCLTEFGQYDRALYYQDIAMQSGITDYIADYISSVVNNDEPSSLAEIEKFMTSEDVREGNLSMDEFRSFLNRRKVYYFVEMRRYDEAVAILDELKKDPAQTEWANSELEYIGEIRPE